MINLKSKMDRYPFTAVEQELSRDGRFGWFLTIWHKERKSVIEELRTEIRLAIMNSDINFISKAEAESWLKKFFNDLHWRLYGLMQKSDLQEKGLSVFFGILFDHDLIFVQFGRTFCSLSDGKKLKHIGTNYRHHQIQTLSKMMLLGFEDKDIKVKVERVFIEAGSHFIVLSGNLAERVYDGTRELDTLVQYIESYGTEENPLWLILEGQDRLISPMRRKLSRLQISSFVIFFITFLAILYILFGNRFLDQALHRTRMNVKSRQGLRLDKIPNTLVVDSQNVIKYMERIVNLPARDIELQHLWNAALDYQITAAPVFSLSTIFLTADNKVIAFDKRSRNLIWKKSYTSAVTAIFYQDNYLIVCLEEDMAFGYREDGLEVWKAELGAPAEANLKPSSIRIAPGDDPRLDRPVQIICGAKELSVLDAARGETLSKINFLKEIWALSQYDNYANCFYLVVEDALICIQLKILN